MTEILDNESGLSARQKINALLEKYGDDADSLQFTAALRTKLNAIEESATADQTGAEIKALYEAETNAFTDAQFTKLAGVEASATADQTGAEIKAAYEAQGDTNAYTDADKAIVANAPIFDDTAALVASAAVSVGTTRLTADNQIFDIVADGTHTADSRTVFDLTGVTGQAVAKGVKLAAHTGPAFQAIDAASPSDYDSNTAVLAIQQHSTGTLANGLLRENAIFEFRDSVNGTVTSATSSGVITGQGVRSFVSKTNNGSSHALTLTGELGATGTGTAYNELGGLQGEMTNVGSTNGYMSFLEGHMKDSPDEGANHYATRMTGAALGIKKYNTTTMRADSIHVLNEGQTGSQDLDTILYASTSSHGKWKRGLDLYGDGSFNFTSTHAMRIKHNDKIQWTDGSSNAEIYVNSSAQIILDAQQILTGGRGSTSNPFIAPSSDPNTGMYSAGADQIGLVAGGVEGIRCFSNNIQLSISGGALKTVTASANDEHSSGFRYLLIENA